MLVMLVIEGSRVKVYNHYIDYTGALTGTEAVLFLCSERSQSTWGKATHTHCVYFSWLSNQKRCIHFMSVHTYIQKPVIYILCLLFLTRSVSRYQFTDDTVISMSSMSFCCRGLPTEWYLHFRLKGCSKEVGPFWLTDYPLPIEDGASAWCAWTLCSLA